MLYVAVSQIIHQTVMNSDKHTYRSKGGRDYQMPFKVKISRHRDRHFNIMYDH